MPRSAQVRTKPRRLMTFQSIHRATPVEPNSTAVRQQLYNTQQPQFNLLPLWRLRCFVCVQGPQPAASRSSSNSDSTASAAVRRNQQTVSRREVHFKPFSLAVYAVLCLLCTCITPKVKLSTLWQPCMVQLPPYVKFFRDGYELCCFCVYVGVCVLCGRAILNTMTNLDDSNSHFL